MSRAPVLLQADRRRADRRFSRGDAGVAVGSIGAKGVPRIGACRSVRKQEYMYQKISIRDVTVSIIRTDASKRYSHVERGGITYFFLTFILFMSLLALSDSCVRRKEAVLVDSYRERVGSRDDTLAEIWRWCSFSAR